MFGRATERKKLSGFTPEKGMRVFPYQKSLLYTFAFNVSCHFLFALAIKNLEQAKEPISYQRFEMYMAYALFLCKAFVYGFLMRSTFLTLQRFFQFFSFYDQRHWMFEKDPSISKEQIMWTLLALLLNTLFVPCLDFFWNLRPDLRPTAWDFLNRTASWSGREQYHMIFLIFCLWVSLFVTHHFFDRCAQRPLALYMEKHKPALESIRVYLSSLPQKINFCPQDRGLHPPPSSAAVFLQLYSGTSDEDMEVAAATAAAAKREAMMYQSFQPILDPDYQP